MDETITAILKLVEDCIARIDREPPARRQELADIRRRLEELEAELKRKSMYFYIEKIPQLSAWLEELGHQPGDVAAISIDYNVTRDTIREARENSHWKLWKPGETIAVTLFLADATVHRREFSRLDWISVKTA